MSTVKKLIFKVIGETQMHCNGCAKSVEIGLSMLPGVQQVHADQASQFIEVKTGVNGPGLDLLKDQLATMGYQVELRN